MRFSDANIKKVLRLDKKDRKILQVIAQNARLPISHVARLAGVSRQSAEYRIAQFEEQGILSGSRTVIDSQKFGFFSYHVFLEVHKEKAEKELCERCMKEESVNAVIQHLGRWNYEISIMAQNPKEFNNTLQALTKGLEVSSSTFGIILKTIKAQVLPGKSIEEKKPAKAYEPDKQDVALLSMLARNAQLRVLELARQVKLSAETVTKRIKALRESGYILQFRPVIDYAQLGKSVECLLIAGHLNHDFKSWIAEQKSVLWCAQTVGNWDYIIYVLSDRLDEVHEFAGDLKRRFGEKISATEVLLSSKNLKYLFWTDAIGKQFKGVKVD